MFSDQLFVSSVVSFLFHFRSLQVKVGFSHHNLDLAADTCNNEKPLVFVLDNKPKKDEEEERPTKKLKKEPKKESKKKGKKNKAATC